MDRSVCRYQHTPELNLNASLQKRIRAQINLPPLMATELIWYFFARLSAKIAAWQDDWGRERARKRLEVKAAELKGGWEFTRPHLLNDLRAMDWEDMRVLAEEWGIVSFQRYPSGIVEAIDEALLAAQVREAAKKLEV